MTQPRYARVAIAALSIGLMAGTSVAQTQTPTLAEVARREQARRKTITPPQKVITNDDLPAVPSRPPASEPGSPAGETAPNAGAEPSAPAAPGGVTEPAKPEPATKPATNDEAYWRARIDEPRQALHRSEVLVEALQSRVNALSTDFVNRDDPFQRAQIGDDRAKALAELDRLQKEIVELKKAVADVEEEARRAGVPPGWLR